MRLRNKRTGEIGYLIVGKGSDHYIVATDEWDDCGKYTSLAELNEEWEDVPEEPKEYWYIDPMVCGVYCTKIKKDEDLYDFNKQIGNYFLLREEAEKAVEKLKAWKRLEDKGFRFSHHSFLDRRISYKVPVADEKIGKDLDLLFGGEE